MTIIFLIIYCSSFGYHYCYYHDSWNSETNIEEKTVH